ncbi:O-methyltransferase-like protein, partial [Leptotrombidium deliense]
MESNNDSAPNDFEILEKMWDLIYANVKWFVIYTSLRLNIIDHLFNEIMTSEKLAQLTKTDHSKLVRLLRALIKIGLIERCDKQLYKVTKLGSFLKTDHPYGCRKMCLLNNVQNAAMVNLSKCIQTNEDPFELSYGFDYWEYLRRTPDENRILHDAVDVLSEHFVSSFDYDWKQFDRFIEIRCCGERMIKKILNLCPNSSAVVMAKDEMFDDISEKICKTDISDRCKIVKGHFLKQIPAHGDCYIINFLLQDWTDEN